MNDELVIIRKKEKKYIAVTSKSKIEYEIFLESNWNSCLVGFDAHILLPTLPRNT